MKQLSRIMSTYSADISGVCSALYELGGMVVMHDASGCNSSYTTFDEPRWYDMDSMIFGSGLDENDAMLGDDNKLISDVVSAAAQLNPNFIAIAGGPVPMMIGTDFTGIAEVIEHRTGIPTFGFFTNGMNYYCSGAEMAFEAIAKRFCNSELPKVKSEKPAVNIIGVTPLDFSIKENIPTLRALLENIGYKIVSVWAMGSSFEEIKSASRAQVNVVVSSCGFLAARYFYEKFKIPFVTGLPIGANTSEELFKLIDKAVIEGKNQNLLKVDCGGNFSKRNEKTLIIGEQIYANSMRCCLTADYGLNNVNTLCPLSPDQSFLLPGDTVCDAESEIEKIMADYDIIIADPIYKLLLPENSKKFFIEMPHEAFSGRIYRDKSPCIIGEAVHSHLAKYLTK